MIVIFIAHQPCIAIETKEYADGWGMCHWEKIPKKMISTKKMIPLEIEPTNQQSERHSATEP